MFTCIVLLLTTAACGEQVGESVAAAAPMPADAGAPARAAVLDRYDEPVSDRALVTPDVVGLSRTDAESVFAAAGLTSKVVPYDPAQPVTTQWPAAGQPVPLDGSIEVWLGSPPPPTDAPPDPAAAPDQADQADQADDSASVDTARPADEPATSTQTVAVAQQAAPDVAEPVEQPATRPVEPAPRFVLPPHTDGLLRTNPRGLPALPQGTQLSGTASWYGPGFNGRQTACGGIYDQNGATIAARELRCGTVVRITGPSGSTVEATVTDWGPAEWTGRRFDLSAAVFNAIAPLGSGVVAVRLVTANVPG